MCTSKSRGQIVAERNEAATSIMSLVSAGLNTAVSQTNEANSRKKQSETAKATATKRKRTATAKRKPETTPKVEVTEENAGRIKNAHAFDAITAAKLKTMSMSQLQKLAKKAVLYDVGSSKWAAQTEAEATRQFDLLGSAQSKTSLVKAIMRAKKAAKAFQ